MSDLIEIPDGSDFPLENLPYGVFSLPGEERRRIGVAVGTEVLELCFLGDDPVFAEPSLNGLMARGRLFWEETRRRLEDSLVEPRSEDALARHLFPLESVSLHLPFAVADYVDFYASEHHATNMGKLFRPGSEPLTPNWKHLPIGYHGRAGTVVVSGSPLRRPSGQRKAPSDEAPTFGPTRRLDIEAEVGFVVGAPAPEGRVKTGDFADHVFGVVLVNDWSARDIHAWEYVPLGPFLGKSFATSISPWVVPLAALGEARVAPPHQEPSPLAYLQEEEPWGLDLTLSVELNGTVVARPRFAEMYWTAAQQLAHMTVNGAALRTGDLFASGTVSGKERGQWGSFLELTWNGTEPLTLEDGSTRAFLEDGDRVVIRASAPGPAGSRIGFGEVSGTILPAAE